MEILNLDGIDMAIKFAEMVESPDKVGYSLGCVADEETDRTLLPAYLVSGNRKLSLFTSGYIWSRHYINGWSWVDGLDKTSWSAE